ncbi:lamin tail domain-containing protein [Leifsonia sp. NPDC058248]|uniref:lamin tail domain-containing protein n=1 Tax=Leifsonia sp. NPDC058248 TaxID=3346402 RepID=UPI0036DEE914
MRTHRRGIVAALVTGLVVTAPLVALAGPAAAATSTVVINEVESNGGTPGDWIELKNTGATSVDVSGYILRDNVDTDAYTIPAGTVIAADGYYAADVAAAFGLGSADDARLYLPDGTTLLDSYTWTAHAATTYGRCPDGTGAFTTTGSSTKGAVNDCSVPVSTDLKINEVESNGGTPGDWIELTNIGATPVDASGYILRDNDDTHAFVIPAGTTVASGGFYAADVDPSFGLGSADSARLFGPDGTTLVDSYSWTAHAATTYGRCPDGTGAFATTASSTKGTANDCGLPATPPGVKINEVESNGGTPGDWVELINTGSTGVDLTGWSVLDNDDTHTAVPLPAGSTIAAGGYFVVEEATLGFGLGAPDQARLFDASHTLVDSYSWTAHAATTYGRCPNGSGAFTTTTSSTKGAANDCGVPVKINEVESNGGAPGDWIELINNGSSTVDLSGYILRDNDDTHTFTIPAGTTVAAGGYLAEDVETAFGLGSADSARLFGPDGTTLIDTYSWTAHAATTYGRCPNGTGAFETTTASTKGAPNACAGTVTTSPWPGGATIATADDANVLGGNMSGLVYQASGTSAPGVLWAVKNGPGTLFRLIWNGTVWTPDTANGWGAGKALHYPDGTGDPDSEGVTVTAAGPDGGVYVSTERNNSANGVSRPEVLRFDPTQAGTSLTATGEWNLTADLPVVAPNSGLEAVTWIPDSYLTQNGFVDQATGAAYDPGAHPGHGSGLFFVGLEANGSIYAYALNQASGAYTRVATISSGMPGVMDLQFDPETQSLWAVCDDTCNGQTETLAIAKTGTDAGRFTVGNAYARPSGMPNLNNEGFVMAPQAECVNGLKPVFWSDDTNDDGHALRAGTIDCTVVTGPGGGQPGGGQPGGGQPGTATVSLGLGTITAGSALHLTASGFTAGETVEVWLHSAPVKLATAVASGAGTVNLTVTIPASTTPGAHTLVVNGVTSGITGSAALTVTAAAVDPGAAAPVVNDAAGLAATGSSVTVPLTVALLLALLGVALLGFRMRRPSRP